MITEIFATGKTVNDAVEELKKKLCVDDLDEIEWNVVSAGKKGGLFGIGAAPAKVVAHVETPDEKPEVKPEVKPEAKPEAKPEIKVKPEEKKPEETVKADAPKHAPAANRENRENRGAKREAQPRREAAPKAPVSEPKPKKPKTPTTEAEVTAAKNFVEMLAKDLELNVTTAVSTDDENCARISIAGDDAGVLIGHHGETLDALQYLANLAANRAEGKDDHERISVDVEGYREKREETLRALARRMAGKVQKYGRSVVLEPMNPYERRIIHSECQEIEGISTNSIGSDNNRKVVIFLTEKGMGRLPQRNDDRPDHRRNDRSRRRPRKPMNAAEGAETAVETASAGDEITDNE